MICTKYTYFVFSEEAVQVIYETVHIARPSQRSSNDCLKLNELNLADRQKLLQLYPFVKIHLRNIIWGNLKRVPKKFSILV